MKTLEVLFTPADFTALSSRNLDRALCVVLDVFRATSTMITALANGAAAVVPVGEIPDALAIRQRQPDALLAGERDGVRIPAARANGTGFDLGNSPREFTREKVAGKTIVMTTTNGTRALRACAGAKLVLLGSFLNLGATTEFLRRQHADELLVVCSGTLTQAAYEDTLCAGALIESLGGIGAAGVADSALMARRLFESARSDLSAAASQSRNGRRLLANPDLRDDVAFCLRRDVFDFAAGMRGDGTIGKCE